MWKQTTLSPAVTQPASRHPPRKDIDDGVIAIILIIVGGGKWRFVLKEARRYQSRDNNQEDVQICFEEGCRHTLVIEALGICDEFSPPLFSKSHYHCQCRNHHNHHHHHHHSHNHQSQSH